MDAKTLAALKASIVKWDANAEVPNLARAKTEPEDCPLCGLFWGNPDKEAKTDCLGCPVAERSGQIYCRKTPYIDAMVARHNYAISSFKHFARAEADFLRSLLPEGEAAP